MKKITIGILAGVIMFMASILVGQVFMFIAPELKNEYQNPHIFRSWEDPMMSFFYVVPFLTGILLAWIWEVTKIVIKGDGMTAKGLNFGLMYWLITLPGLIMTYSSFQLSLMIVFSWVITNLVQALCAGLLFSKMLKIQLP